jgi:hypothetical protein
MSETKRMTYAAIPLASPWQRGYSWAVWGYDLDQPRNNPDPLPQGAAVECFGTFASRDAAWDAMQRAALKEDGR